MVSVTFMTNYKTVCEFSLVSDISGLDLARRFPEYVYCTVLMEQSATRY